MSAPIHPEVMYAERSSDSDPEKNIIYLTFRIDDLQPGYKIDLKPESISFAGVSGDPSKGLPQKKWATTLEFYHEIDPENSKEQPYTGRDLLLILRKKDLKKEYWPRLTKQKTDRNFIKTDFQRWADEDEQEEIAGEFDGDDFGAMPGGGMMPGMGGGTTGMPPGLDMASLMGGMGGGAGGAGGQPDFAKLMAQMGGAGGAGGAGGMPDLSQLMAQAGAAGGAGAPGDVEVETDEVEVEEVPKEGAAEAKK